ncbi:DNA damage-binding protein cmr1 [Penicillium malachiteum]|uniref:DNA damage-binding protein CMR1 n=1 Tax=Penicillium malachiteum TaxID=1324776 RepID=A0AAD6HPG4_9EURO|nr:DNA damage-binding protein cmr1 [Penicillium malachiteum]
MKYHESALSLVERQETALRSGMYGEEEEEVGPEAFLLGPFGEGEDGDLEEDDDDEPSDYYEGDDEHAEWSDGELPTIETSGQHTGTRRPSAHVETPRGFVADFRARTFDRVDVVETVDPGLKRDRLELANMRLCEGQFRPYHNKVTHGQITSMAIHPTETKALIYAGDDDGHLALFEAPGETMELGYPSPIVDLFKPHSDTVWCTKIHPGKPTSVFTASQDGTIQEFDIETELSFKRFWPRRRNQTGGSTWLDMAPMDTNTLYWTEARGNRGMDGVFGMYDMRTPRNDAREWSIGYVAPMTSCSLYPPEPHYFATASGRLYTEVWDLRRMDTTQPPRPVAQRPSALGLEHATFNAEGHLATLSIENKVRVYDFKSFFSEEQEPNRARSPFEDGAPAPPSFFPTAVIEHSLQFSGVSDRMMRCVRPHWHPAPRSSGQKFCIPNRDGFVDIFNAKGDHLAQLGGHGISDIPIVSVFHPTNNWVAGGTSNGDIALWM